ncbi:MAG: thiamine phosphate synthase [Methyloceanibacter sp.]
MAPCRLYLTLPAAARLESSLAQALDQADVACVLLCGDGAPSDTPWDLQLRELTREREVAFLIENDAGRAERLGADGIHIAADVAFYRQAHDHLGQRSIIGAGCIASRHDAMIMAELGVDYVAFGPAKANEAARDRRAELIAWWTEIFEVPCVAWDVETAEEAERLAGLGADFIALSTAIWQAEGAAQRIATIDAALRRGRTAA